MLTPDQIIRNVQLGLNQLISDVMDGKDGDAKYQIVNTILELAENPNAEDVPEDFILIQNSLQDPINTLLLTVAGEKTNLDAEIARHCAYYTIICTIYAQIKNDASAMKAPVCQRMNELLARIAQQQNALKRQAGLEYGAYIQQRYRGLTLFAYCYRAYIYASSCFLLLTLFALVNINVSAIRRGSYVIAIILPVIILSNVMIHFNDQTFRKRELEKMITEQQHLAAMIQAANQYYYTLTQPLKDYLNTLTAEEEAMKFNTEAQQFVGTAANMTPV